MQISRSKLLLLLMAITVSAKAQQAIALYQDSIPNSSGHKMREQPVKYGKMTIGIRNISEPLLTVFLPTAESSNGTAVIICPGGGYAFENNIAEGSRIAGALAKYGITAFVLKYRLPSDSIMKDKSIGPLQDAQQAIKLIRQQSAKWGLNPNRIGMMGFSAGGHLAASAAVHFNTSFIPNNERTSLRPDFSILVYPVISFTDSLTHQGSRDLLLGPNPPAKQVIFFSNEQQVNGQTPPTWITHAGDDKLVTVENSIRYYQALLRNGVPAEMHLYPKGGHGFVLFQPLEDWMLPILEWMKKGGWITN